MVQLSKQEQLRKLEQQQAALAQKKAKIKQQIAKESRSADTKIKSFLGGSLLSLLVTDEQTQTGEYKAQYVDIRRLYEQLIPITNQIRNSGILRETPANLTDQKTIITTLENEIRERKTQQQHHDFQENWQ